MENSYNRMLRVLKQCEGGIESGARTHDNRGIIYLSEFGHTFLMHIKETIYRAEQAQQAEPRCACGDSFTNDAVCSNCLAAQPPAVPDGWVKVAEALLSDYRYRDDSYSRTRNGRLFCSHCGEDCEDADRHADDCPVLAARAMLAAAQKGGA